MAPTSKENEVLVASPEAPATVSAPAAFRPDETASRPQPVALEIPVTVNGARTVEGSDKREPFSETTKTVLVFGNGAVIRLSSPVSAGQLLFLTNEKTKKEVVCQVVKSKNYRNVSGYVELEFTESVVGFWGMRFPTDRIAAPTPAPTATIPPAARVAPPAPAAPVAPKVVAPVVSVAPRTPEVTPVPVPVAPKPVAQPPLAEATTVPPVVAQAPAAPSVVPSTPLVPVAPIAKTPEASATPSPTIAASLASSVASLLASPEVPSATVVPKPPAPQVTPQTTPSIAKNGDETSMEELKQHTARLQEQLSSMLFSSTPLATPTTPAPQHPALDSTAPTRLTSKVLELAKVDPPPVKSLPVAKPAPPPIKSALDTEGVKIPSWLEPLARNAAAPASTQELVEREKARHAADVATREEVQAETPVAAVAPETTPEAELPGVGSLLPLEGDVLTQQSSGGAKKGLWMGVAAAAVLVAVGGGWYFLRPSSSVPGVSSAATRSAAAQTNSAAPLASAAQPAGQPAAQNTVAAVETSPSSHVYEPASNPPATKPAVNTQPVPATRENARNSGSAVPPGSAERNSRPAAVATADAAPEPKKPALGEVHLASPTVNRTVSAQDDGLAAPTISSSADTTPNLNTELVAETSKQPAAPEVPLPVGGDVKPARLLSSVPPMYPSLAKAQHLTGDVSIDALIDANGKVSSMKVVSGPALLRQAAMDALRQWKYQPASLDGKAVPMHLTVTLQFRMQ